MPQLHLSSEILSPMVVLSIRVIQSFELALILISICMSATVLRIFYKTPLLHRNLLGLLGMITLGYGIVMISRIVMLVLSFDNDDYMANPNLVVKTGSFAPIEWVRVFGCGVIMFGIICISIERSIATIYLETYEKSNNNTFLIFSFIFQASFSTIFTYLFFKDILSYIEIICIGVAMCGFIFATFITVHRINVNRYKMSMMTLQDRIPRYTLSERFQLAENIRTFKILKRVMIFIILSNVVIIIALVIVMFFHHDVSMIAFRAIFNIIIIIYSIFVPVIFVTSVEIWRLKYFRLLTTAKNQILCRRRRVEDSSLRKLQHLRSTNGQQLAFHSEKERDMAFRQLENAWN